MEVKLGRRVHRHLACEHARFHLKNTPSTRRCNSRQSNLGRLTAEFHNLGLTRTYYPSYESLLLLLSARRSRASRREVGTGRFYSGPSLSKKKKSENWKITRYSDSEFLSLTQPD